MVWPMYMSRGHDDVMTLVIACVMIFIGIPHQQGLQQIKYIFCNSGYLLFTNIIGCIRKTNDCMGYRVVWRWGEGEVAKEREG